MLGYRRGWAGFLKERLAELRAGAAAAIDGGYLAKSGLEDELAEELEWIRGAIRKDRGVMRRFQRKVRRLAYKPHNTEYGEYWVGMLNQAEAEMAASCAFRDEVKEGLSELKRMRKREADALARIYRELRAEGLIR